MVSRSQATCEPIMTTYEPTAGSIEHIELYSDDPESTESFFEDVFGWTFQYDDEYDYRSWRAPNPPNGGLMSMDDEQSMPARTLLYIDVDDIAATSDAIVASGGEVLVEETDIPDMGAFIVFRDPGDVVAAAWENRYDGEPPEGGWPVITDDADAGSIVHFELYSTDLEASESFFSSIFGWRFETDDDYTMVSPPTPPFGGMMAATDEYPAGTMVYLLVPDAETACATVEESGGKVLREPFVIEGHGRMAIFESPGSIVQAIWEANETMEAVSAEAERQSAS